MTSSTAGTIAALRALRHAAWIGLAALPWVAAPVLADDEEQMPPTVAVDGEGLVAAAPDIATVIAGVVSEADSAAAALAANNEAMAALLQALREHGIAERDIATTTFSVEPRYRQPDQRDEPPGIVGYAVSNQVRVRIRDLERLGSLLDLVVRSGANQVGGIQFGIDDDAELLAQARRLAFADARARAELYAAEAGARLGRLRSLSETNLQPFPGGDFRMRAMAMEAAVPVAGGERELRIGVHAVFELRYAKER